MHGTIAIDDLVAWAFASQSVCLSRERLFLLIRQIMVLLRCGHYYYIIVATC